MPNDEQITADLVDELIDSTVSDPTLVRYHDGTLNVVPGRLAHYWKVVATLDDYTVYCDGQDDAEQRASFLIDLQTVDGA